MTNTEDLQAHLHYWQQALGLASWEVDLRVVRRWAMPIANAVGCCARTPEMQRAVIHVMDPVDVEPGAWPYDPEVTLVHELLHAYHFREETGTAAELLEEQGVEMTARALVRLRRAAGGADSAPPPATTGTR